MIEILFLHLTFSNGINHVHLIIVFGKFALETGYRKLSFHTIKSVNISFVSS